MHLFNTQNYKILENFFNMLGTQLDQSGFSTEIKSRLWSVFHAYWPWAMTQDASKHPPEKRLYLLFKKAIEAALEAQPELANTDQHTQALALATELAQTRIHKTRALLVDERSSTRSAWNPAEQHMSTLLGTANFYCYEPRKIDSELSIQEIKTSIYRALIGEDVWPPLPALSDPLPPTPAHIKNIANILIRAGVTSTELKSVNQSQLVSVLETELTQRGLASKPPSNNIQ